MLVIHQLLQFVQQHFVCISLEQFGCIQLFNKTSHIATFIIFVLESTKDKCSVAAAMGDCLATIDMGRKEGGCCAPFFWGGEVGSPSNTV